MQQELVIMHNLIVGVVLLTISSQTSVAAQLTLKADIWQATSEEQTAERPRPFDKRPTPEKDCGANPLVVSY